MTVRPHHDHNNPEPVALLARAHDQGGRTRAATRITVIARAFDGELPRDFETVGQAAYALLTLVDAGERGATAEECSKGDFDLATGCHDLQRELSLTIRSDREAHPGGQRVRYVLKTLVDLLSMERIEGRVA